MHLPYAIESSEQFAVAAINLVACLVGCFLSNVIVESDYDSCYKNGGE